MNRYIGILAFFFAFSYSQIKAADEIKIDGPKTGEIKELIQVKLVADKDVKDLKINVFKDGQVATQGYTALKDFDNVPVILFVVKEEGLYTLVIAGNKANNTIVAIHYLQIGKPSPTPTPTPTNSFAKELSDLYKSAPDQQGLADLIGIFEEVKGKIEQLKNYGDFQTVIENAGKRSNKLLSVRSRISKYLVDTIGIDPRAWDATKAQKATDEIIAALKAIGA